MTACEIIWLSRPGKKSKKTWVLWAIKRPTHLYGLSAALKQYEFIWLSGRGSKSKTGPVSCQTPYNFIYAVWTALKRYELILFSGPGNKSKIRVVSSQTLYKSIWLSNGCGTTWMTASGFLGPVINRRRVLWACRHSINLHGFWTALKQYTRNRKFPLPWRDMNNLTADSSTCLAEELISINSLRKSQRPPWPRQAVKEMLAGKRSTTLSAHLRAIQFVSRPTRNRRKPASFYYKCN